MTEPELGDLEAEVLRALQKIGRASAAEVVEELKPQRALAYTTVSTTLDRLHKKGLLSRQSVTGRTGQKHVYSFPGNSALERRVVNRMIDKLVRAFGPSVASTIYDRLSEVSPAEVEKLREEIDRKKRNREGRAP